MDRFNPDMVDKASDNTDALDDDERKAGMRSRCVWYKNGHRTVQYTSSDMQDGVSNVAFHAHVLDCLINVLFTRSSKGPMEKAILYYYEEGCCQHSYESSGG